MACSPISDNLAKLLVYEDSVKMDQRLVEGLQDAPKIQNDEASENMTVSHIFRCRHTLCD